ncbi:hypothetical protein ACU610_21640 [Geodermatophilus sp. URMC 61]|uniref:hypothetical protein n=1 Tax=Geodermatophilus sp. URMC 61 TaxID=3423411 RepID=UPI00406D3599
MLLFVVGTTATAVGMVLDGALLGALHGSVQLHGNMEFGVLKLVLLIAAGWLALGGGGLTLFGTWVVGLVLFLAGLAVLRRNWTRALLRSCACRRWSSSCATWRRPYCGTRC